MAHDSARSVKAAGKKRANPATASDDSETGRLPLQYGVEATEQSEKSAKAAGKQRAGHASAPNDNEADDDKDAGHDVPQDPRLATISAIMNAPLTIQTKVWPSPARDRVTMNEWILFKRLDIMMTKLDHIERRLIIQGLGPGSFTEADDQDESDEDDRDEHGDEEDAEMNADANAPGRTASAS